MAGKGQVTVRIVGDAKDLKRALGDAGGSVDKFGNQVEKTSDRLKNASEKMTKFATVPIAAAMGLAAKSASELEQSVGGVESVFGSASESIFAFGETAAQTSGLSQRQVNEMAAVIGASLQGMGFNADEAAAQVLTLETRAADMAATFGGDTQEAITAVSSALRGERDPIERYGVSIKQVDVNARIMALGLDTSTVAAEKKSTAIATLDLIMESTAKTEGQFAREAEGAAGSMAIAKAEMENAGAEIGQHLLPLLASAAGAVSDMAQQFGDLSPSVQKAVLAFAGLLAAVGPLLSVTGNVLKLGQSIGNLGTKIPALEGTSGAFGKLAKAGVAVGVAFVAIQALSQWAKATADNVPSVERLTSSLLDLADTGRATGEVAAILGDDFEDLGKKLELAGNSEFSLFDSAGIRQVQEANQQIDALDKSLASLFSQNPAQARALFEQIRTSAEAQGVSIGTLRDRFNDYVNAVEGASNAQRAGANASGALESGLDGVAGAADDARLSLDEMADAQRDAIDAGISYERALIGLEGANAAVTEAQAALAGGGGSVADSQEKVADAARAVEDAQRGVVDAHRAVESAGRAVEASHRGVEDAMRSQVDAALAVEDAELGIVDAARDIVDAERGVQDALRGVDEAQRGITESSRGVEDAHDRIARSAEDLADAERGVVEAQKDVLDLAGELDLLLKGYGKGSDEAAEAAEGLDDAQRDLQRSQLGVTDAQRKLDEVLNDATSTAEDVQRAQLDLADAEDRLQSATKSVDEATKDYQETVSGVPATSDAAKEAQDRLTEAENRLEDANKRVTDATRGATEAQRGLTEANRAVEEATRTLETAERAVTDAARGVDDAHRGAADASRTLDDAHRGVTDAAQGVEDAHQGVADAARDLDDAHRGVADANREVQEAERSRSEAMTGGGPGVSDRAARERDLESALLDQREAYLSAADAYVERAVEIAAANGQTLTASERSQLFKDKLSELAGTLAPDSPLRRDLQAYIDQLANIPRDIAVRIQQTVSTVGGAIGQVGRNVGDGPGDAPRAGGSTLSRVMGLLPAGASISSTYRTPEHNRRVGGSPRSYHIDASNPAVDIVGSTATLDRVASILRSNGPWREGPLWRVPNHAPGDNPHVHVAHSGGRVTSGGIEPIRKDELLTKLQVGEVVLTKDQQAAPASVGSFPDPAYWGREAARAYASEMLRQNRVA